MFSRLFDFECRHYQQAKNSQNLWGAKGYMQPGMSYRGLFVYCVLTYVHSHVNFVVLP